MSVNMGCASSHTVYYSITHMFFFIPLWDYSNAESLFATSGVNLESMTAKARASGTVRRGSTGNWEGHELFWAYNLGRHRFFCGLKPLETWLIGDMAKPIHQRHHIFLKRLRIQGGRNREDDCDELTPNFYLGRKNPVAEKYRLGKKTFTGNISFEIKSCVLEQSQITGCIDHLSDLSVGWVWGR